MWQPIINPVRAYTISKTVENNDETINATLEEYINNNYQLTYSIYDSTNNKVILFFFQLQQEVL